MLPVYVTMGIFVIAVSTISGMLVLPPRGVELSDASHKFVMHNRAINHCYSRYSGRYHRYSVWRSQNMLPIRFGEYFVINKDTSSVFCNLLMSNLTDAI